jgi:hypothetical protein
MLVFARFIMRDSGLPILINTPHVTQVRLTVDGEPAIYLAGKDTPILVEGTFDGALKKLEAAAAGLRIVDPEPATHEPEVASITALPAPATPTPSPQPTTEPELSPVGHDGRKLSKPAAKASRKKAAAGPSPEVHRAPEPEKAQAPSTHSWFKGLS